MKKGLLLQLILAASGLGGASTAIASGGQVIFADDFSSDPNTSGKWVIRKNHTDPHIGVWDSALQAFHLTTVNGGCSGISALANVDLTEKTWNASFNYRIGGANFAGADGIVFMFYKKRNYVPHLGGFLGFDSATGGAAPGLGIEFDNWQNGGFGDSSANHIALIENSVTNHLVLVNDPRTEDNQWHSVLVSFNEGHIVVQVDDDEVINYTHPMPDYTFSGVGFSSGLCAGKNNQTIKDFALTLPAIEVAIDVKPGSDPNSINLKSSGKVPAAILGSPSFDVTLIDPLTVELGGAPVTLKKNGAPMASFEDVNSDGELDMVVHVSIQTLELNGEETEVTLTGQLFDSTDIVGSDSVNIVSAH